MKKLIIIKVGIVLLIISLVFDFNLVNADDLTLPETASSTTEETVDVLPIVDGEFQVFLEEVASSTNDVAILIPLASSTDLDVIDESTSSSSIFKETLVIEEASSTPENASSTFAFDDKALLEEESVDLVSMKSEESVATSKIVRDEVVVNLKVPTSIIRDSIFQAPKIMAQWQMLATTSKGEYLDDSSDEGAQILPSGRFEVKQEITICALVADNFGSDDSVSSVVNYPENTAYSVDDSLRGCGREQGRVDLSLVDASLANNMLCEEIRLNNNNLLTWSTDTNESYTYSYDQVCGYEGFLATKKASIYCATSSLDYDDPAGNYRIETIARNIEDEIDVMGSNLKYLELTNYEKDFDDIQYGMVTQNKIKYLYGDLNWGNGEAPTIRNTGNTRLQVKIWQNDFNLGKTGDIWNVAYKARLGSDSLYVDYYPEATTTIDIILDLGDIVNIDLAILINNFPENKDQVSFFGEMTMSAQKMPELICQL